MSSGHAIQKVASDHSGAQFYRCALQVNPHHYSGTFRGQAGDGNASEYVKAIIEKALETGISVLAVTDHNSVKDVPLFQDAAKPQGIHVFPGFEISSREGIHILCIYPKEESCDRLERYLGEFGIRDPDPSSQLSDKAFGDILEKVRDQGGATIAAHSTLSNGLFKVLVGGPRIRAWQDENLLCIQIPGPVQDLPQEFRLIVENKDVNYQRGRMVGETNAVAVVNAKDIAKPDDLDDKSATCWIKMSEVTIEGLRQAFLDPDSRIRLNSDPLPEEHAELLSLNWEGGFLDGTTVHFNPNLNVLVGGRGAGKSTVIESLRYVLGLEAVGGEARNSHSGMVLNVLRSGTKISLRVRSHRPSRRDYLIERTIPNPPIVRDEDRQISNLLPQDIFPRVEIYGQHEISELTKSREKLTSLLNRFVQPEASLPRRKANVRWGLEQTRRSVLEVQAELRQIDDRLAALPRLEETLSRYQEADLEARLQERILLVREERVFDSIPERLSTFRECLEMLRQGLPIDRAFLSERALSELPGKAILADADPVLERLSQDLEQVANLLDAVLERARQGIEDIHSRWEVRESEVEADYQKILRELERAAVDAEDFIKLRQEIERLRPLGERRTLLENLEKEHTDKRTALLVEWEEVKAEEFRLLARAAEKVRRNLLNRVQVEVTSAGNRDPLFQILRDEIGGRLSEAFDILAGEPQLSLTELIECWKRGPNALRDAYGFSINQANRLADAPAEVLMRIEELDLLPTTSIRLNTAPTGADPVWQSLEELSTGQKATAVLLLLLLESDAPLVVDQPEDDLDNRFITEGVVPRMREEKRRRQFIFSTHNANIPVLGDAELIMGLTPSGEAEHGKATIRPEHVGSIDALAVRELVEDILEGGKEAFETRRRKYGF